MSFLGAGNVQQMTPRGRNIALQGHCSSWAQNHCSSLLSPSTVHCPYWETTNKKKDNWTEYESSSVPRALLAMFAVPTSLGAVKRLSRVWAHWGPWEWCQPLLSKPQRPLHLDITMFPWDFMKDLSARTCLRELLWLWLGGPFFVQEALVVYRQLFLPISHPDWPVP